MLTYELTIKDSLSHYTLDIEDAKKLASHLKNFSKGSFAYVHWLKPIRSAVRKKETEITITTSGFDTHEFFQILCNVAGGFENTQEVDRLDEDFTNWLVMGFDYSGEGIEGENYWLSKSPTDFNIYSETQLKKKYYGLGKSVDSPTKAW